MGGWEDLIEGMSSEHAVKCRNQVLFETKQHDGANIVAAALVFFETPRVQTLKKLDSSKDLAKQRKFQELAEAHKVDLVALADAVRRLYGPKTGCVRFAPAFVSHLKAAQANSAATGIQKKRKIVEALKAGGVVDPTPKQVSAVLSGKLEASHLKSLGAAFDPNGGSAVSQHRNAQAKETLGAAHDPNGGSAFDQHKNAQAKETLGAAYDPNGGSAVNQHKNAQAKETLGAAHDPNGGSAATQLNYQQAEATLKQMEVKNTQFESATGSEAAVMLRHYADQNRCDEEGIAYPIRVCNKALQWFGASVALRNHLKMKAEKEYELECAAEFAAMKGVAREHMRLGL
jgi:hypothetical protein